MATQFGGSFAPPLTDEKLAAYKAQIEDLSPSPLRDGLNVLHNCASQWWEQPESTGDGRPHASGKGVIVDLDEAIKTALDQHIPWKSELEMIQKLCDAIPAEQKELRNCAFHLLWHAIELELDREPLTNDKL